MLDIDQFIDDVRRGRSEAEPEPERAIREVLSEAVANPGAVLDALGETSRAGIGTALIWAVDCSPVGAENSTL